MRTHRDRIRLFAQMSESAQLRGLGHAEKRWTNASQESEHLIAVLEDAMASLRKSGSGSDIEA